MTTRAQVLAAAKQRCGFCRERTYEVRENRNAPNATEREAASKRRTEITERIKSIEAELATLPAVGKVHAELVAAAQFVRDVNGDAPSIPQLAEVLARVERIDALIDERRDLKTERDSCHAYGCRWRVGHTDKSGMGSMFFTVDAQADTLDELLAKLESKAELAICGGESA